MAEKSDQKSNQKSESKMQSIVSWAKRRGFVFPSSEIYGGMQGFYDFGPLGVEMKKNLKNLWWDWMTKKHDNILGIDGAIITNPRVWEASGHIKSFVDPLSECKKCHHRFKSDDLIGAENKCPDCDGELTEPRTYNILVPTEIGVIEGEKIKAYLRGEACQTIYLDYKNVLDSNRIKIPFGIVQIGKAFRNEITPGNFLYRQREFEQWDLQWFKSYFTHPEKLGFFKHEKLAHYAKKAFDIQYDGKEIEGIHWRGDWDLSQHMKFSGENMTYTSENGEKFIPNIVETSGGVDRMFMFLLLDAYEESDGSDGREKGEVVLHLNPKVAPVKAVVLPLSKKLSEESKKVYQDLKSEFGAIEYDEGGSIGRRYRRQDEIGTPYCLTFDFDSLKDKKVTVRDRDSMKQERVAIKDLKEYIREKIK
jgi:glycyl-tRNA synthetase